MLTRPYRSGRPHHAHRPQRQPAFRRPVWPLWIATSIPIAACVFAFSLGPSPEKALKAFYAFPGTDERAVDSLREAGDKIVPILIGEVGKKEMPRRRNAIQFLADGHHHAALSAFELILRDETEDPVVRAEVLRAIDRIDPTRGKEQAQLLAWRSDSLGSAAKALRGGHSPSFGEFPRLSRD